MSLQKHPTAESTIRQIPLSGGLLHARLACEVLSAVPELPRARALERRVSVGSPGGTRPSERADGQAGELGEASSLGVSWQRWKDAWRRIDGCV